MLIYGNWGCSRPIPLHKINLPISNLILLCITRGNAQSMDITYYEYKIKNVGKLSNLTIKGQGIILAWELSDGELSDGNCQAGNPAYLILTLDTL